MHDNALFAISMCRALGMESNEIAGGLTTFRKVDGRMQEFLINRNIWKLNLVKNPAAANLTLSEFLRTNEKKTTDFLFK